MRPELQAAADEVERLTKARRLAPANSKERSDLLRQLLAAHRKLGEAQRAEDSPINRR